jgi:hypothetical protein
MTRTRPIIADDLRGLPGLRRAAIDAIVATQPATVLDTLRIRDVGRKTTQALLDAGLITDPEGVQRRSVYDVVEREKLGAWKVR